MRFALRVLQAGAVAVVVAVSTHVSFELDRFFVPKELVLHLAALLAGVFVIRRVPRTRADLFLLGFLLLSLISAALAQNRWLGVRALAISASGVVLFWAARALRVSGLARPLLGVLALATVVVAVTSLLQAYGVETLLFSENRAPGGTLGNRNFVAHAAAFGLPLLLYAAFTAPSFAGLLFSTCGIAVVTATLVLTRSRAAWLAFAAVVFITLVAILRSRLLRADGRTWRRLVFILAFTGGGVAAALLIPNTLRWRDDNPYLATVQRVADYEGGSGRGRLIQYRQSLEMAVRHPLFGAGPGNWAVEYPGHAARNDPSMNDSEPGMTFNPWPSSDWVAFVSERGFAAAALLAAAFLLLGWDGLRRDDFSGVALLGTVVGAGVTGLFDAVLLLPLPAFLVWSALGALSGVEAVGVGDDGTDGTDGTDGVRIRAVFVTAVLALSLLGVFRSGAQLASMQLYQNGQFSRAAEVDPGNYRARLRLARSGKRKARCEHAEAAHTLYPHARAAATLAQRCR